MDDKLRVAIVGGSETARRLITDFISRPFVEVVAVADTKEDSPGAIAAQGAGIRFTTDLTDLAAIEPAPDLVIDVCGRPHVNPTLEATFPPDDTDGPTIVHEVVARLVLSLAADSRVLAPGCDTTLPPALQI
jgi:hypothetical protein